MAVLLRMIEACLLVAMGSFMAVLSQSSMYWQFLNPRYAWLTLGAGAVLVVVGFGCFFNTTRKRRVTELLSIVAFLLLVWVALTMTPFFTDEALSPFGDLAGDSFDKPAPTVEIDGDEYIRINVAELYVGEQEGTVTPGQAYAMQGTVLRTKELDQAGYIGLGRLLIQCCFADAVGVVSLVKVDDPGAYKEGAWARVAGVVEKGTPFPGSSITVKGALTLVRSERFSLRAESVEETKMEGLPFIFEIRPAPPYAY